MHSNNLQQEAIQLRTKGYSYKEISQSLHIAKSTAYAWTCTIMLSEPAQKRLRKRLIIGQRNSRRTQSRRNREKLDIIREGQQEYLDNLVQIPERLLCAMIYWCEGAKDSQTVRFTNSDPRLVKTFLKLFRNAFTDLDESKFRVIMHLHDYHDEKKQRAFWSQLMNIQETQFTKTFHKPNTGKVKREGYPGCVHIKYYDARIAKMLMFLAESYMK